MSEQNKKNQPIDDMLSDFTDQIIGSDNPNLVQLSSDEQVNQLQATILQLNQAAPKPASTESAAKIKKNVQLAWDELQVVKPGVFEVIRERLKNCKENQTIPIPHTPPANHSGQDRGCRSSGDPCSVRLFANSGFSGGSTSGAAVGDLNPWVIVGGLGLLGGAAVLIWIKSRRN